MDLYIYLDIVAEFACGMCGRCCRNDWQVSVDEAAFRRNADYFAGEGRHEEFRQSFIPLTGAVAPGEYAFIAKTGSGHCWFLDASRLCRLHRDAGHDHLDNVCQTYPRYPMDTARGVEFTLSFSCPRVLDLASRPQPLEIVRCDKIAGFLWPESYVTAVYPGQQPLDTPLRHYFELEQHLIDIMQWRGLTVTERVDVLAAAVQAVGALPKNESLGGNINMIIHRNYEYMDSRPGQLEQCLQIADLLSENFLVNMLFKKVLYRYGLERGLQLLTAAWGRIAAARAAGASPEADIERTREAIIALELEYSHRRVS
jgi:lysine-N-methylase